MPPATPYAPPKIGCRHRTPPRASTNPPSTTGPPAHSRAGPETPPRYSSCRNQSPAPRPWQTQPPLTTVRAYPPGSLAPQRISPPTPPGIDLAAAVMLRVLRALRVGFQRRVYSPVLTTRENMDVGGA